MEELRILNGRCPDFERNELRHADLTVSDGVITGIYPTGGAPQAARELDAAGCVVSPGWIDMHMHEENFAADGCKPGISELMVRMGVTTGVCGNCGDQYQPVRVLREAIAANGGWPMQYVPLAGYNQYRHSLCHLGFYDPATPAQREEVRAALQRELDGGAWGISFGLEYDPGISTEEMTQAVRALEGEDLMVSIHFRADCDGCLDSVREMAQLSRDTGRKVEISHLGSLAATAGNMAPSLEIINREMAENPKLGYDVYPYTAFCTAIGSAVFDMDWRSKWNRDYDCIQLLYPPYQNQRCTEELYERLRREQPEQNVVVFAMDEEQVAMAIANPNGFFGSDGGLSGGAGHPRAAGTFPRILGRYVREQGVLTLMQALDKLTRRPARYLGLRDRGEIRPGFRADLTIFDPDTIRDGARFDDLYVPNVGIRHVLVGGVAALEDGRRTGAMPGALLTRA
ncbi:amidohydrolase family protein [Flavonifractor hominis]|uniref:Amidohydrolase family protein n=1 Tax=Flavonifractor hominis TaxID=3133178 RepID=A0ABV1EUA7_9FIRM